MELQANCRATHDAALRTPQPAQSCQSSLQQYQQQSMCQDVMVPSSHGGGDDETAVCKAFLECVQRVAPDTLATLDATYGPGGSCWKNGDSVKKTCLDSCKSSLDQYVQIGECQSFQADAGSPEPKVENEVAAVCKVESICHATPGASQQQIDTDRRACEAGKQAEIDSATAACKDGWRQSFRCKTDRGCNVMPSCELTDQSCYPPAPVPP
jgi:hypothetical protein